MEQAARLLRETDDKTYLIAEQTGYTDPNYFSYVFKRHFGVSPSKFRAGQAGQAGEAHGSGDARERPSTQLSGITELGATVAENRREHFQCISLIGQIEGHYLLPEGQKATKYEHVIPLLVSIEEDDETDGLLVLLNTMGGDVEAGLAIAEIIASMRKPTVSLVLGGSHSIGVPLATAAKRSLIVPSATMTIHPVRVSGTVIGVPQSFRYMSEMQDRIVRFICAHSKADPRTINELMMTEFAPIVDVAFSADMEKKLDQVESVTFCGETMTVKG